MISGLKPLGSAPSFEVNRAWDVARLWDIARIRSEKNKPDLNLLSVFLGRGVIPYHKGGGQVHKPSLDLSAYQVVYPGDLVLNNQQAWRGSVGVSRHVGIVSPAYLVLALRDSLDPHFADYLFQSRVMVSQFVTSSKGVGDIQRDVHTPWLKNIRVPIPPFIEQAAIVHYLDYMDWRIRHYIRAKQKLIKLLEEQKQAIIHRAVTRGLDPNVRLKPSGVEWLGDIPGHWSILPIKRAFQSMDYGISESATDSGAIRLLTMGNIKNGQVSVPDNGGVDIVDPNLLLAPNDLLFNRTNSPELVGKVGLFRDSQTKVTFASYLVRMRPRLDQDAEYLNYLLNNRSVLDMARREAIPSLHQSNLNPTRYGRLYVGLPPLAEQRAIVQRIKVATRTLDRGLATAEHEIALLREYRTCLIADIVTGKLDVREAAARLPDEVEEQEPLGEPETLTDTDGAPDGAYEDEPPEEAEA